MVDVGVMENRGITVVVADRHDLVRRALTDLINVEPGFAVVAQAGDADTAAGEVRAQRPSLLLVEPLVLGDRGLARLPVLLDASPVTRAVVLADEASPALERHAHGLGAVATILKHAAPDELFAALRRAVTLQPRFDARPATEG
jgi:DNA-binding NarL/FixJ family response regulator